MKTKALIYSLFLLAGFSGLAQTAPNVTDASGKKQGHWIKLNEEKKKVYDGNFVNDIPQGKFTYYYPEGDVKAITVFSGNGKIARTQLFALGGKLMGEGKYVNEKKDSIWKFYDDDGKLISDEIYVLGQKNGTCRVYYSNGQISEEKNWKLGKLDGPCKKYFESGQVKYTGQYINDKVEGKVVYYHPNGKINATGIYKNDLKDGDWNYYKEDGTLERTDKYVNGKMTSTDKEVITHEEEEKEKKQYEQFEIKDPYQEGYRPE